MVWVEESGADRSRLLHCPFLMWPISQTKRRVLCAVIRHKPKSWRRVSVSGHEGPVGRSARTGRCGSRVEQEDTASALQLIAADCLVGAVA